MPKKKTEFNPLLAIGLVLVIALAALCAYFFLKPAPPAISTSGNNEKAPVKAQGPAPLPEPENLKNQQTPQTQPEEPEQTLYRQAPMEAALTDPCLASIKKLDTFFIYLDSQDYIKAYQFPEGSKAFIAAAVNKLLQNPPPLLTKSSAAQARLAAAAHIFRQLGGQRIAIFKKIITNEPDKIEEVLADFHQWTELAPECSNRVFAITPTTASLYPYAQFFLTTAQGKAYLARRSPQMQMLAAYYSLEVVAAWHRQNKSTFTPGQTEALLALIARLETDNTLAGRDRYLTRLYAMREKAIAL